MKFVLASHNQGKLAEMQRILGQLGVEVVLQSELGLALEPEETGTTFTENARIKAEAVMQASGLPAIADDSGLCVDALNGAPGVYSARYGGLDDDVARYRLLLENLRGAGTRAAHFHTSVVCCFLGIQAELWTLKTLITLGFWSWFGVGLVLLFLVLHVVHGVEKRSSRRRLDKAMKQAEKQKEEEVSRARAEGAAAERERAEAEAAARAEEEAREEAARAAAEAAAAQDAPSGETAPAEANEAAEAATEE